jgi:hypothetical protein
MKFSRLVAATAFAILPIGAALAAPTAEEVKQLGTTLTAWGAIKAGNADGTIPPYEGGLTTPPPNYDKSNPGWRPDPFPNDKPLFKIDASNMDQHADKLSDGIKAMLKKYPTFHLNVYPTRRTAAYPQKVLDETQKNIERCKMREDGDGLNPECRGGFPFPLPKNGHEVMWNKNATFFGEAKIDHRVSDYVKPNGEVVTTFAGPIYIEAGLHNERKPEWYFLQRTEFTGPARSNGMTTIYYDLVANNERRSWSYLPATRRVRLAPDSAADTPIAAIGNAEVYDSSFMFVGKRDRYNFELIGKEEKYIPYNEYRLMYPEKGSPCEAEKRFMPNHIRPECQRWELHRVWHVRLTLKEGKRHIYGKRDFYIDEDAYYGGLQENYDLEGKIYRVDMTGITPAYEVPAPGIDNQINHDLISGVYSAFYVTSKGTTVVPALKPGEVTSESITSQILK